MDLNANQTYEGIKMKEIFGALAKAQKNFEAALKGAQNPHFRSKYAALDACMDAVRMPLNEQGVFITQVIDSVEGGVLIETVFAHESGEVYTGGKLFMPVAKHDAQGYGSAITYGRRYSLLTACGVAPEDDDGNKAVAAAPTKIMHRPSEGSIIDPCRESILTDVATAMQDRFESNDILGAVEEYSCITDPEEKTAVWKLLPSHIRSAIKKHGETLKQVA